MTYKLSKQSYAKVIVGIVKDEHVSDRCEASFKNGSSSLKTMTWFVVMRDGLL